MRADAHGPRQPGLKLDLGRFAERAQLTLHLAQQHAPIGALTAQNLAQPLELLGVRVAPDAPAQRSTFALVRYLQLQFDALRQPRDLFARDLWPPAVRV